MLQRRKPDPALGGVKQAFASTAASVDEAQRALLAAIPTSRDPGIPIAQALKAFGGALDAASNSMERWRDDRVAAEWRTCLEALQEARDQAERLRLSDGDLTFEQLNALVGDVLYPLETFADAERNLRRR